MDFKTVLGSAAASAVVVAIGVPAMATFVTLQPGSPGTAETGHTNITGYAIAGRVGAGGSPTLARVQAVETGGLQGVRAETTTGTSVFGKSTATTGLGAGGYFTSSSVGGRGMVADALSATGNTVGGLFYNHSSSTSGVGVWGRILGAGASGIGVLGDSATATGTGLVAQNGPAGNSLTAGSPNDSLRTKGKLPRHDYVADTPVAMVPVAYGLIGTAGTVIRGSGNFTVAKPGTGTYEIDLAGFDDENVIMVATALQSGGGEYASHYYGGTGESFVYITDSATDTLVDSVFSFVMYRAEGTTVMAMPRDLSDPAGRRMYGDLEVWEKKDPKGFNEWLRKQKAWIREHTKSDSATSPVDHQYGPQ